MNIDPQFQAAVDAQVGAVMCSYNRINGTYACENPQTLSDLKNGMGFQVLSSFIAPRPISQLMEVFI
jgi:beta-glucosidase